MGLEASDDLEAEKFGFDTGARQREELQAFWNEEDQPIKAGLTHFLEIIVCLQYHKACPRQMNVIDSSPHQLHAL